MAHSQTPLSLEFDYEFNYCKRGVRNQFTLGCSCVVRGYPSFGGIILGEFDAAELEWLNVSRSENQYRSPDPAVEDKFCYQMLHLGARWGKSESFHDKRASDTSGGYPWPDHFPPGLDVGYPSTGGVWVFKIKSGESLPNGFGKVELAFTMDERSAALEKMGATFYGNVDECGDIAKSLEDGKRIGQWWEEKMKGIDTILDPF